MRYNKISFVITNRYHLRPVKRRRRSYSFRRHTLRRHERSCKYHGFFARNGRAVPPQADAEGLTGGTSGIRAPAILPRRLSDPQQGAGVPGWPLSFLVTFFFLATQKEKSNVPA